MFLRGNEGRGYESDEDRKNEREIADQFERVTGWVLEKIPGEGEQLDFYARDKTGALVAVCEAKARTYDYRTLDRWGGFDLDWSKWKAADERCTPLKLPFFLLTRLKDDGYFYAYFPHDGEHIHSVCQPPPTLTKGGTKKHGNDPVDIHVQIRIPMINFKRFA